MQACKEQTEAVSDTVGPGGPYSLGGGHWIVSCSWSVACFCSTISAIFCYVYLLIVLFSTGTELISFMVSGMMPCCGFRRKTMWVTVMFSCCWAVLRRAKDVSACPALPVKGLRAPGAGRGWNQDSCPKLATEIFCTTWHCMKNCKTERKLVGRSEDCWACLAGDEQLLVHYLFCKHMYVITVLSLFSVGK